MGMNVAFFAANERQTLYYLQPITKKRCILAANGRQTFYFLQPIRYIIGNALLTSVKHLKAL